MRNNFLMAVVALSAVLADGSAMAIEMDDLEVTIRVIESNKEDKDDIGHKLELPDFNEAQRDRHGEGASAGSESTGRENTGSESTGGGEKERFEHRSEAGEQEDYGDSSREQRGEHETSGEHRQESTEDREQALKEYEEKKEDYSETKEDYDDAREEYDEVKEDYEDAKDDYEDTRDDSEEVVDDN